MRFQTKSILSTGATCLTLMLLALNVWAADDTQTAESERLKLENVTVTATDNRQVPVTEPEKTVIDFENYEKAAPIHNVVDVLRDSALVDFRGKSDIDVRSERNESPILLRGFGVRRYVNAIDGVTFDQPLHFGQIVDYSLVPLGQIESVEIIPGAHSARYSGKAMGGVINFKTKVPEVKKSAKPDVSIESSYGSFDTWDNKVALEGGYDGFNFATTYHKYTTDGYLRHGASEMENYGWMLGYALSSGGYFKYMGNYVEKDRESYVTNDPSGDYDPTYPEVLTGTSGAGSIASDTKSHIETSVQRFSFLQPTPIGDFSAGLSYTEKKEHYYTYLSAGNLVTYPNSTGKNIAFNVQDELELFDKHTLVMGFDYLAYYASFEPREEDDNRVRNHRSGFVEDTWQITDRLTVRAGLRYEDVKLSINNYSTISGWGSVAGYQVTLDPPQKYIKKDFDEWMPKFFATYKLDDHAAWLRDTSVSIGISKFWNVAPFCLFCPGRYAQVDPEHGMNYDLIVNRRLWRDIQLKVDYSYYKIKDYVAYNWDYAEYYYTDPTAPAGLEGSDMYINLDEVIRHGLEVEINGRLIDSLSFYISYAFQEYDYDGPEPAGMELGDVAKHRVNAGLRYRPLDKTVVMLDYKYQDEQIAHEVTESPDGSGNYVSYDNPMAAYNVFDLGINQTLCSGTRWVKDLAIGFYVKNLFNEEYENSQGYPMTEQSFIAKLSFRY
ncbi:TonB-dependent receptor [Desulfosarcina ovata subsp. sediminis]|uniref:TonB-dependent receptor n=1 Tax=Desulfosarcina ovata subsp. sediminis TaxID=885957 RepID=A0A5K7ZLV9_9BACT|nr:TonB-dependent receptor [Desulfosarcina ovata]BBO82116.1 TonB-dependent receptor [Desulfosarcina ovata subsp. sediminis]